MAPQFLLFLNISSKQWKENIKDLELNLSLEQISEISKYALQKLLSKKAEVKALEFLNKEKKSKTKHIVHTKLQIQPYLRPGNMSNMQRKFIFQLRAKMLDVKANYQGSHSNLKCELCEKHIDNQESLLVCEKLGGDAGLVSNLPLYDDLFSADVTKQISISSILEEQFKMRKKLIEAMKKK